MLIIATTFIFSNIKSSSSGGNGEIRDKYQSSIVNDLPETSSWLSSPIDWFQRKANLDTRRKSTGFAANQSRRAADELDASLWDDLTADSSMSPFTPGSPSMNLGKPQHSTTNHVKSELLELSLESVDCEIPICENIMAPMVEKLPNSSLVEVIIQSKTERV